MHDSLSQALLKQKLLTEKDLKAARDIQAEQGGALGTILVKKGLISEKDLIAVMSTVFSIPAINLSRYKIEKDLMSVVPEKIARQYKAVPICKLGTTLVVAMVDPLNVLAIDDLKMLTKFSIEPVLATEEDITQTIDRLFASEGKVLSDVINGHAKEESVIEIVDVLKEEFDITDAALEGETPPIVKMVNLILFEALRKRASDIHIEPEEKDLKVRYRIDGSLHDALRLPKKNQNAILARLKIMSGMDITEFRVPQDGRFKIKMQNKEVDFRVSALPTSFGAKMVLRALDKSNLSIGLDKLGFSEYALKKFKEATQKPFGMILVTGPTGSGKSTTLYSILNRLNTADKNIITVEDPVEYQVEGITQIQA
ncbi:MAG: Flp pilus assembly complex ATPase component TadA, partial [Candidatus Omnitrophica bacterium]|nr:Flp pilus assembly complex ATPase component TadA [Candidatus Omnitrophota bacterium]